MDPINYQLHVQNPFQQALQGVQAGVNIGNAITQGQQQQNAIKQQQQMQQDLGMLAQKPNPTAQDFAQITTKYPSLAEHFKNTWSMLNADQQQSKLGQTTQVFAALNAGKPEIASKILADQAAGLRNSGQDQEAKAADTLSQLITQSPETAKATAGLQLAAVMGPDKFADTFKTLETLPATVAQGKAEATQKEVEAAFSPARQSLELAQKASEIKNIDSQIIDRSGRLGLDKDKLQSETEQKLMELKQKQDPSLNLDAGATKIINDSTVASVASGQMADRMTNLANDLESTGAGYGSFGTAAEWLKQKTGNQDELTRMRQEYTRLRSSQVSSMLPPGAASDRDIELAMQGFPPPTADTKQMASFMRGMAKLNQVAAATDGAKAEWAQSVGNLGKPRRDIEIDGIKVPAGTTFPDFAKQYVAKKAEQKTTAAAQQQIQGRSYMKYANPQPGQ